MRPGDDRRRRDRDADDFESRAPVEEPVAPRRRSGPRPPAKFGRRRRAPPHVARRRAGTRSRAPRRRGPGEARRSRALRRADVFRPFADDDGAPRPSRAFAAPGAFSRAAREDARRDGGALVEADRLGERGRGSARRRARLGLVGVERERRVGPKRRVGLRGEVEGASTMSASGARTTRSGGADRAAARAALRPASGASPTRAAPAPRRRWPHPLARRVRQATGGASWPPSARSQQSRADAVRTTARFVTTTSTRRVARAGEIATSRAARSVTRRRPHQVALTRHESRAVAERRESRAPARACAAPSTCSETRLGGAVGSRRTRRRPARRSAAPYASSATRRSAPTWFTSTPGGGAGNARGDSGASRALRRCARAVGRCERDERRRRNATKIARSARPLTRGSCGPIRATPERRSRAAHVHLIVIGFFFTAAGDDGDLTDADDATSRPCRCRWQLMVASCAGRTRPPCSSGRAARSLFCARARSTVRSRACPT